MSDADGKGSSITEFIGPGGHGELAGVATATQLPNIPCKGVMFKARDTNTGTVAIGMAATVTLPAGTTTTTAGWPLSAREETGYIPCLNLNQFYRICTGTGDALSYFYFT